MYSLDINFLNDRSERPSGGGKFDKKPKAVSAQKLSPVPMLLGLAAMLALPAFVGAYWFVLVGQKGAMEERKATLDSELAALQAQLQEVEAMKAKVAAMEADNQAIASVFDRIQSWSAILQDLRGRVPSGVQVDLIEQFTPAAVAAQPVAASPSPSASASPGAPAAPAVPAEVIPLPKVRIKGLAKSFNDVNDFVLTLQRSPFLEGKDAKLISSKLIDRKATVTFSDPQDQANFDIKFPKVVEFTLESGLTTQPTSKLMQDLQRTLSVGLSSRIQALRDRGVLKK
jgi:type IV pilus assembly protein PilN